MHITKLSLQEISLLEDSVYFANRAIEALVLQKRRILSYEKINIEGFWEHVADINFFLVAFRRLRRSLSIAAEIPKLEMEVKQILYNLDKDTGNTKVIRDIFEHIDDYIHQSKKRRHDVPNSKLYSILIDGDEICWMDQVLDLAKIFLAAEHAFMEHRTLVKQEFRIYR